MNSRFGDREAEFNDAHNAELTFVVDNYTVLSMVANATGVPLEDRLLETPQKLA